jgi:Tol biopolymer transport system component
MRTTSLIPLAAVLAAAALPGSASAALPGTVVFHQKDFQDEFSQLYLARADGSSGARTLTTPDSAPDPSGCWGGNCGAEYPEWAPDGSRIFFDSSWTPFIHTWSVAPDGSDPVMEPAIRSFDGTPSLSPDGRLLAIDGGDEDSTRNGIYVRDRVTGAVTRLTTGPRDGFDSHPDFAPDGSSVIFQRVQFTCPTHGECPKGPRAFRAEIWAVDTDGTNLRRLLSGGRVWGDPHYSPDGTKILVHAYDDRATQGANANQFTIRPDGSGLTQLTNEPRGELAFSGDWSPDGQHIAYVSYTRGDDHLEIRSMTASGQDESLIAGCDPMLFCDVPNWSVYAGSLPAAADVRAGVASAARRHMSRRAAKRFARRVAGTLARG